MQSLKEQVYEANMELSRRGLVVLTWGNVSQVDRERGIVAIKPSGVPYETMTPEQIVLLDLETGRPLEEGLKPSSDAPTHLALYRAFAEIGGVTHTHSPCATAWAQAGCEIPCFGTTHADSFRGAVPVTRFLTPEETEDAYEANTGKVIVEAFGPQPRPHARRARPRPRAVHLGTGRHGQRAQRHCARGGRPDGHVDALPRARRRIAARPHRRQAFPAQTRSQRLLRAGNPFCASGMNFVPVFCILCTIFNS